MQAFAVVLLAVECGLRRSEIAGLCWGDVAFGAGPDDPTRGIEVRHARPRGGPTEAPKSGRVRRPHISRRLWLALRPAAVAQVCASSTMTNSGQVRRNS